MGHEIQNMKVCNISLFIEKYYKEEIVYNMINMDDYLLWRKSW